MKPGDIVRRLVFLIKRFEIAPDNDIENEIQQLKSEIIQALEFYEKYFDKSHLFLDQEAYEIFVKTLDENKRKIKILSGLVL